MKTGRVLLFLVLCLCAYGLSFGQSSSPAALATANEFPSYVPYNGKYSYGVNPGYYGDKWSVHSLATIAMGSSQAGVKGAGVKSFRVPIYDDFLSQYGVQAELPDFQYYAALGGGEITAFIGSPSPAHQFDTTFSGSTEPSKVFANLYQPVWLDAAKTQINPNNYFAKYLYDVVKTYGSYVKFWEVVNEPDFTYSSAGWSGDSNPAGSDSWFYHNPNASELVNLRAPVFYYIRELRVAWEVIKQLSPQSYICTGGIGYRSFLDALLRNTDNPVDGSVTSDYPLKAGAYFDVLSFHSYPEYALKRWDNTLGKMVYSRHSDAAIGVLTGLKDNMDKVLANYGYDGKQFPAKQYICTESGISRVMDGEDWGSVEGQRNYIVKAQVIAQKRGIRQAYWYQLGDGSTTNQFDRMGLYFYFGDASPYNQLTLSDEGIGLKTTSDLLYGKTYDSAATVLLNLPDSVEGAAFKAADGSYTYVLWARTTTDMSELATASFSFPAGIASGNLTRKEWNFSETGQATTVAGSNITLSAAPAFFEAVPVATLPNQPPKADAGPDQVITLPQDSVVLTGKGTDVDGNIVTYSWTALGGPTVPQILSAAAAQTTVNNLITGRYQFELTVTDNQGASAKDTVTVTVNSRANTAPQANAGSDIVITLPSNNATLNGSGTDKEGNIAAYKWTKISGPSQYAIAEASRPQTTVSGLVQGVYLFELSVTDSAGAVGKDTTQITVNPQPVKIVPPTIHAGPDQTITLPIHDVFLQGEVLNAEGVHLTYQWSQLDGPSHVAVMTAAQLQTWAKGLSQGVYHFMLTVTDDKGNAWTDTMMVTVKPAPQVTSTAAIYPVPATSFINLQITALTKANLTVVQIYNTSGALVYQEQFMRSEPLIQRRINISNLTPGSYFVVTSADINTPVTLKFVKQ